METKKATQEAASKGRINDSANLAQSSERQKQNGKKVTEIFAGAQPKVSPNRVSFGAVLSGNYQPKHGALDFPPPADDLKEFPVWGLPNELQDIIIDVAKGFKCSPTIPAVAMLAAAAAAIGKGVFSIIDNHHNYPSLWPLIIGSPSASKSGPSSFFFERLDYHEEQAENTYNAELANWINGGRKGVEPKLHQHGIGSASDEVMLKILAENDGVGYLRLDEFATMAGSWGRYAKNGNGYILGILESIFSQQKTKVSTIARGTASIKKPVLTLFATTNPTNFSRIMRSFLADNGGLFERFLPVSVDKVKCCKKRERHTISPQSRDVWDKYIDRMLYLQRKELKELPQAAEWRIKAEDYWAVCADNAEENEADEFLGQVIGSCYSKASYTLYRLAMVVAVLMDEDVINAPAMRCAAECTQFFLNHQIQWAIRLIKPADTKLSNAQVARFLVSDKGVKQAEVARLLRVSDAAVSQWMHQ